MLNEPQFHELVDTAQDLRVGRMSVVGHMPIVHDEGESTPLPEEPSQVTWIGLEALHEALDSGVVINLAVDSDGAGSLAQRIQQNIEKIEGLRDWMR